MRSYQFGLQGLHDSVYVADKKKGYDIRCLYDSSLEHGKILLHNLKDICMVPSCI